MYKLEELKDFYKEISNSIITQNQEISDEKFKKVSEFLNPHKNKN